MAARKQGEKCFIPGISDNLKFDNYLNQMKMQDEVCSWKGAFSALIRAP
jgi:hypothetical protein